MMLRLGTLISTSVSTGEAGAFSPSALAPLAWYDPSYTAGLWKDTAGTSPVTADGDAVARIDDRSGNGRHMLQSTLANRPLWKTSGGLSWLEFDGSNDWMVASGATVTPPSSHEITAAGTCTLSVGTNGSYLSFADNAFLGGTADAEMLVYNDSGAYRVRSRYTGVDNFSTGAIISSQPFVIAQSRVDSTILNQYVLGAKVGSTITTATTLGANKYLRVGLVTSSGQTINGRIYGIVLSAALSAGDRASLTTWIGAKAGLTL